MTEVAVLREWCLAHILVTWRNEQGPLLRKAYKAAEPERTELARGALDRMRGYVRALESVLDEESA